MKYGKILKIEKVSRVIFYDQSSRKYEGYRIRTDKEDILVLIDSGQSCCESFGILHSYEDPDEFVGGIINEVSVVNTNLNKNTDPGDLYDGDCMFVNVETDKGTFQLALYNSHNGYYGHNVRLVIGDELVEECII